MYRDLLIVALCLHTTSPAPQDNRNTDITYFKIHPVVKVTSEVTTNIKELVTDNPSKLTDVAIKTDSLNQSHISETELLNEPVLEVNDTKTDKRSASEVTLDTSRKNKNQLEPEANDTKTDKRSANKDQSLKTLPENSQADINEDSKLANTDINQNDSDNIPSETKLEREARDFDQTTSSYETETVIVTEQSQVIEDTKTSPKYTPKISYLKKYEGSTKNSIESTSKRRFRSRCRCAKIWNCPKLQISVPRCPEEQFMCCF